MGTKKNKEEVVEKEIVIITDEQVDALPEKAVATVRSLKGSLPHAQLQIFIPVVQQYIELRDMASKLKLEKDADGNITKESIETYKEVKKAVGAFNGELKRRINDVKNPLNAIKSDVMTVENTFKEESDKIKEAVTTEFQPYEDEVAAKKKAAEDKKNAALIKAKEEAEEAAEAMRKQSLQGEVINKLKYTEIMEGVTQKTIDAVAEMNPRSLEQYLHVVRNTDFADITGKYDITVVGAETLEQIEQSFAKARANAINLIDERLARYAEDQKRAIEDGIRNAPVVPPVPPVLVQQETDPSNQRFYNHPNLPIPLRWRTDEEFIDKIKSLVGALELAVDYRLEEGVTPQLAELKMKFNQFNS